MGKKMLRVAVYPLLLINLALGFVMFAITHQVVLILLALVYQSSEVGFGNLGPFTFINQSVSMIWAIVLGIAALISFPLLESYYERGTDSGKHLFIRFLKATGIQMAYIGIIFAGIQVTVLFW